MSDNCLEVLLKELQKNGVLLRKVPFNPDKFTVDELEIEAVKLDPFNFLDFSEHDKVFEDKIESLEKKNKDLKSCFTQREQDSTDMIMKLKQEKLDKNEKIAELTCENESLKRRIDELESKETKKPTKTNLNDRIKVKLTPLGAEIYYHQYDEVSIAYNCNLTTCRYNENGKCTNEEKRNECVEVSLCVLCLEKRDMVIKS